MLVIHRDQLSLLFYARAARSPGIYEQRDYLSVRVELAMSSALSEMIHPV